MAGFTALFSFRECALSLSLSLSLSLYNYNNNYKVRETRHEENKADVLTIRIIEFQLSRSPWLKALPHYARNNETGSPLFPLYVFRVYV